MVKPLKFQTHTISQIILGHHFKVATNPWSHHLLGDEIPETDPDWSESNKYRNYWGYEYDMLAIISDVLNFTYTMENPPDGQWGHVSPEGNWDGLVNHAAKNIVDFVICDVFIVYGRAQVFDGSMPFDKDYLVHCAPQAQLLPKWLALIYPFDGIVWLNIFISLFVASVVFLILANTEGPLVGDRLREWSTYKESFWYAYGTLMGESITRDTRSEKALALR